MTAKYYPVIAPLGNGYNIWEHPEDALVAAKIIVAITELLQDFPEHWEIKLVRAMTKG